MNVNLRALIISSDIGKELIAALTLVAANRAVTTPQVLIDFTDYVNPTPPPSNTVRNTAILAILARLTLTETANLHL